MTQQKIKELKQSLN
ncbi:hypothetical protein A2U01_0086267, partial [Trifolium medium]|nr:hypothetical protein [Trifolium medium]MCI65009.1 hypothetical protein [Trifolium medium]